MKKAKTIISMALCILTVLSLFTVFTGCGKKTEPETTTTQPTTEEKTTVEIPEVTTEEKTTKEDVSTTKHEETTAKPVVPSTTQPSATTKPHTTQAPATTKPHKAEPTTKAPTTTKPHATEPTTKAQTTTFPQTTVPTTKTPTTTLPHTTETTTKRAEPVTERVTKYSCGNANHRCTTKEEHSFIKSLESKGCPTCGSHSCRSFYTVDEWGNISYDITRCPKYSVKEDPSMYCDFCGKKCGLGNNGTCVRFTVDTKCPGCGKTVSAKTCHSH